MKKALTSLALVAGCAISLAVPATQAQTMDAQVRTTAPRLNECGPDKDAQLVRDPQLRASCFEDFLATQDEPSLGGHDRITGSSTGTMNSTGTNSYNPNIPISDAGR